MHRRDFIEIAIGSAVAWPLAAHAQQPTMPVIGFLSNASPNLYVTRLRAFQQGLKEAGYVEGQNVAIEYRWAEGQNNRLPTLATELAHRRVTVLVAGGGTATAMAAKAATTTTPIVFAVAVDPVKAGLVASLIRPGGNMTGVTNLGVEVGPKRLELLHELFPTATAIAVLVNPANPALAEPFVRALLPAASTFGVQLHVLNASSDRDLDTVFATMGQLRASALLIMPDVFFTTRAEQLAALSLRYAVPAIYEYRPFTAAGGLVSYGSDEVEYYRLLGIYAGKILKGEKPANLPVVQSTKVELIINLKTAKALSINVPQPLVGRADEVIE
ncbi:MAG TPA: ABC transporter substrate-binding protein [Pseudolabrys sp.]|nr:ABC transporter substrate-binding protein [Pseudolabrys sp.]